MTKEKLQTIHNELMELGEEAFSERDDFGVQVLGPVLGWLYRKIEQMPPEVPDGSAGD